MFDSWHAFTQSILLAFTGAYAGFGVLHFLGMNPAVRAVPLSTFAEFWQQLDRFMRVRMPPYALTQLALAAISLVGYHDAPRSAAFGWSAAVVALLLIDMVHTIKIHLPLNRIIQGWNPAALPTDAGLVRDRLMSAFTRRSAFMMGSFGCALAAMMTRGAA